MAYDTPYYLTFDENDLPSVRVIQAISSIVDAGRGDLKPLHSVIDPEALNGMVRSGNGSFVSFEYEGFHVTVHSDGKILLRNPASIHTKLNNASNVLLLAPSRDDDDLCSDLCFPSPPDQENVLSVAVDQAADETLDKWNRRGNEMPAQHKIISLGDFARSAGTQTVTLPGSIEAELIADDQNLSTLCERIDGTLSDWQSTPHETVLCFHSVDTLLSQTDLDTTYSFFHTLTSRIADSDADIIAHFHLDPLACDDTAVNVLTPLFDAVVSGDGEHTDSPSA